MSSVGAKARVTTAIKGVATRRAARQVPRTHPSARSLVPNRVAEKIPGLVVVGCNFLDSVFIPLGAEI